MHERQFIFNDANSRRVNLSNNTSRLACKEHSLDWAKLTFSEGLLLCLILDFGLLKRGHLLLQADDFALQ